MQPWLDTKLVTPCTWYCPLTAQCRGPPESPCGARGGVSRGWGGAGAAGAARGPRPDLAAGAHAVAAGAHHGVLDQGAPVGRAGADLVVHDGQGGLEQDAGQLPVACAGPAPVSTAPEPPFAAGKAEPAAPAEPLRPRPYRPGSARARPALGTCVPRAEPRAKPRGPSRAPSAAAAAGGARAGDLGRGEPVTHCGSGPSP